MKTNQIPGAIVSCALAMALCGCAEADRVSQNIARDADDFKVTREVTVINGITDEILYQITGRISVTVSSEGGRLDVIAKTGEETYKKDIFVLGDNTSANIVQIEDSSVDPYNYTARYNPRMWHMFNVEIAED